MSVDKGILTLNSYLLLNTDDSVVQKIINGIIKCDTLELLGTASTFHRSFIGSALYETFWMKLGETVRCVFIEKPGIFQDILHNLYQKNVAIEELSISENVIDYGEIEPDEMHVNVEFCKMLKLFLATLKCVKFKCSVPLQKDVVEKLCCNLEQIFEDLDDVIFNCVPLPKFSSWLIEKAEIKFVNDGSVSKLVVEPLFLRPIREKEAEISFTNRADFLRSLKIKELSSSCEKDCDFNNDVFKSGSVERLNFIYTRNSIDFYRNCFVSFPSVVEVKNLVIQDSEKLDLISKHMHHLKDFSIYLTKDLQNTWPLCSTVENFSITFCNSDYKTFEGLIKSFPNLRKLKVEKFRYDAFFRHFKNDDFARIITENAKKLEHLSIKLRDSELTAVGLDLIRNNLKQLKELHVNCFASVSVIENLFEELPTLEIFSYGHSTLIRRFLKRKPLPNEKQINDLPIELLEHIFLFLSNKEQRICRQVCKYWFNVQKYSPNFDHFLVLRHSYLSYTQKPVNILINTNFSYKIIVFLGTTVATDEDLTAFWKNIGAEVKEIYVIGKGSCIVKDAVKTGLKAEHFPKIKKVKIDNVDLLYDFSEWKALLNRVETLHLYFYPDTTHSTHFSMSNVTQLILNCWNFSEDDSVQGLFQWTHFPKLNFLIIIPSTSRPIDLKQLFESQLNFAQLKTLFIAQDVDDFQLIIKKCPNLECLGIYLDNKKRKVILDNIAKKMFDKLPSSTNLYVVKITHPFQKHYISFQRTEFGFKKSNKSCRELDNIEIYFNSINNDYDFWIIAAKF